MAEKKEQKKSKASGPVARTRLYSRGIFAGYRRNRLMQHPGTALIKIEGVRTRADAKFYVGKKVFFCETLYQICFVYKVARKEGQKNFRQMWGKIIRHHGNSGMVRAAFVKNLPPSAIGKMVRIQMN